MTEPKRGIFSKITDRIYARLLKLVIEGNQAIEVLGQQEYDRMMQKGEELEANLGTTERPKEGAKKGIPASEYPLTALKNEPAVNEVDDGRKA